MRNLLMICLLLACSFVSNARAEMSPEKRNEIQKMLRLTGMEKLVAQMKGQMIAGFKKQFPESTEVFWNKFAEKMNTHELVEKIIPVYDKYYSLEDLRAINLFYQSPAGQKILATMPQVMQESMQIGQEWGERIAKEAAAEVQQQPSRR